MPKKWLHQQAYDHWLPMLDKCKRLTVHLDFDDPIGCVNSLTVESKLGRFDQIPYRFDMLTMVTPGCFDYDTRK
jgi:hypothetical protein